MSPRRPKRAAVYARLSQASEESVSIARQLEAGRAYAESRGWEVVLEAADDGVSATRRAPGARPGWRRILDAEESFEVVIVWKVDRLARRVLDFLQADEALSARGAALVAVEDPIDLTTAQGRAFGQMLAVFGELEAATISARVKGARKHLLDHGRVAGGERPWWLAKGPHESGVGYRLVTIPERVAAIREAADALVAGEASLAEIARRWSADPALTPQRSQTFSWETVRTILANPTLTGATKYRGGLLRDEHGVASRDLDREVLDPATFSKVQDAIAARASRTGHRPIRLPLLHGIALCECGSRLQAHRPSDPKRAARYVCMSRECGQGRPAVSMDRLDEFVIAAFEGVAADLPLEAWEPTPDTSDEIGDLEEALEAVQEALRLTDDEGEETALLARRRGLRARLTEAQDGRLAQRVPIRGLDLLDAWDSTSWDDTATLRAILGDVFAEVRVRKGLRGRHGLDPARVTIVPRVTS